ncbi:hypothetical protein L4D09_22095 [Photobacterium makurazakiensis]|uniref:hypothetical protein n=1 Tax=Photobacterium makurazakiensis TaxID=2910234 RepID=UPI003D11F177
MSAKRKQRRQHQKSVAPVESINGVMTLPVKRAQLICAGVAVVVVVQTGLLLWQNYAHEAAIASKRVQMQEQQLVIDELDERLIALDDDYTSLKQEVSASSLHLVDQNSEIALLEDELKRTKQALKKKSNQVYVLQKNYQSDLNKELAAERKALADSEDLLKSQLTQIQKQEEEISSKISDVNEWEKKRAEFDKLYAMSALEAQNEERVNELMGQFNQLRVDLDVVNECDKDYLYRYNEAKSVLNNIRTFIQKYEMEDDFYFYVISNDSLISAQNRKLCLTD